MNAMNTAWAQTANRIASVLGEYYDYLNISYRKTDASIHANLGEEWVQIKICYNEWQKYAPFACYLETYRMEGGKSTDQHQWLEGGGVEQLQEAVQQLINRKNAA